jgi:RNA polymerase sigma factor (sigma-70 family)
MSRHPTNGGGETKETLLGKGSLFSIINNQGCEVRGSIPAIEPEVSHMDHELPDAEAPFPQSQGSALWEAAFTKYYRLWLNLARSAEVTDDEAKDIVQGVLACILSNPVCQFVSLEHARNYVAKGVLNRVKGLKSRSYRRVKIAEVPEARYAVDPDTSSTEDQQRRCALRKAVRGLNRRDFTILKLRFYSGFTLAQTSELMNIPLSTIASREGVILGRIRTRLLKEGY